MNILNNYRAPLPSQQLEVETKKMIHKSKIYNQQEEKLAFLKAQMEVEKKKKDDQMRTSGSRWKSSATTQPIKNYANVIMETKKQNDQTQKLDYTKLNKEFGEKMAQKSSLKNTSSSMTSIIRPSSNSKVSRQKENQSQSELNRSLNGSFQQSNSKGFLERRNSKDQKTIKQVKGSVTPFLKNILDELNLTRFTDAFVSQGILTEEKFKELNSDTLIKIGIPAGFQIKIMKKINSLNSDKPQLSNKEIESQEQIGKKSSIINLTPRGIAKQQKNLLEEQKNHNQEQLNSEQAINKNKVQMKPPLKKQPSQDLKKVRFDKSPEKLSKIKKTDNSCDKKLLQLHHTETTAIDTQTPSEFLGKKMSCWLCYTIIPEIQTIYGYQKTFCKNECLRSYEDSYIVKCSSQKCQNQVSKQESSYIEGNWYCVGICEPNLKDIEDMWDKQIEMQNFKQQEEENDEQYYERINKDFQNNYVRKNEEYDLKLSAENDLNFDILSLEAIEAKYKLINQKQNIE